MNSYIKSASELGTSQIKEKFTLMNKMEFQEARQGKKKIVKTTRPKKKKKTDYLQGTKARLEPSSLVTKTREWDIFTGLKENKCKPKPPHPRTYCSKMKAKT